MFDILCRAESYSQLQRSGLRLRQFAAMIKELQDFAKENSPDALFDQLMEKTGYIRSLEEKNTVEDTARAENVKELKTSILSYMKESGDETLEGYLANVALYTDMDNYDKETDCVVMMTYIPPRAWNFPACLS